MSGKTGVAIIGGGIFVEEQHLPAVQASEDLELKAIFSRSLKTAESVSRDVSGIDLYSEDSKPLSELLGRSDIHAVIIALPIPNQPEYIKQSLSAGKHVLAEKPIAKDVATARDLLAWYESSIDTSKVFFGIAEQFRFLDPFIKGGQEVTKLGKILNFRIRMQTCVQQGMKYLETPWRKTPTYQGGFLLDGGVHFIAGMRALLGEEKATKVAAFTAQHQSYLPPIDTADATIKLEKGGQGTLSLSFGTTATGNEWVIACEGGEVIVSPLGDNQSLVVKAKGEKEGKSVEAKDAMGGVQKEVFAWAKSIKAGKPDPLQGPKEALADLEILEAMCKSGDRDGIPVDLHYQL